jgi:hypothetical protein
MFVRKFKILIENSGSVPFIVFSLFALLTSTLSIIPTLSFAKSLGFLVSGLGVYYIVFTYFKETIQFLTRLFMVLVLSSFLLPKNIVIYNTSLDLHSGILNQSQAYGWVITLCLPFFLMRAKFNKFDFFHTIVLFGGILYLFSTHMRSAYLALFTLFIVMLFLDDVIKELINSMYPVILAVLIISN